LGSQFNSIWNYSDGLFFTHAIMPITYVKVSAQSGRIGYILSSSFDCVKSTEDDIPIAPVGMNIKIDAVILAPLECGIETNNAAQMPITIHAIKKGKVAIIVTNPLNMP